ncbi:uncharacterized protein LOC117112459 [Anneissia japonica]|uniref:uncharacterized protein LOC117112459 n=1 Tax=Anneissia japonica TaxID=1529436 RepID=UPI001425B5FA|nr:uncharacterized protein LOC117112459 [Anneissia japonica]XP_033111435.1 uncharacterized protein LOC117112459 [Anneissia japonica]XP_033111436.1 uncharacterized protein LOC117112459 [Anneissia japonica]
MDAIRETAFLLKGIQHLDSTNVLPSMLNLTGDAFPLVRSIQGKVLAAATSYHEGRVACIGHEQFVNKTSNTDDFPRFVCNIFNWLAKKKQTPRIGFLVSSGYKGLEEILLEQDFILTYTSPDKLGAVDVIFANCYSNFIEQEFERVCQFVANGGGMLVAGENWYTRSLHANDILLDCGIEISQEQAGGNQDYQPHSLSAQTPTKYNLQLDSGQVNDILWKDIKKLSTENLQPSKLEISGDAFPVITSMEGDIIAAVTSYGRGRIMVLGHEDFVTTKDKDDFPSFILNIFRWMSPERDSPPASVGILLPGFDFLQENLQGNGFKVSLITTDNLCDVDIIFCDCFTKFTEFQLASIDKFLSEGGGMIVAGHNWFYKVDHANLVFLSCGINITMTMAGGNEIFTPETNAFTGKERVVKSTVNEMEVRDLIMEKVKYLNLSNNEPSMLELSKTSFPILETKQGRPIIAASSCGAGKVVVVGHAAYVTKPPGEDDFPVVVANIFKWLCKGVKREEARIGLLVSEGYSQLEITLRESGFHVINITSDRVVMIDALFTDCKKRFTETELVNIFKFVSRGGGLLVAGDNWYQENDYGNDILSASGIKITNKYGGSEANVYNVQSSKTSGQKKLERAYGAHVYQLLRDVNTLNGESTIASLLEMEDTAFPVVKHHNNVIVAASLKGKGKVVTMGHESFINRAENRDDFPQLVINMVKWASSESYGYRVGLLISNYYKGLKAILKKAGISFIDITTDELDSVDVVFADCYTKFSEEALARIHAFVQGGSGLIVAGNNWYTKSTYANNILYGCSIKITQSCGSSLKWTKPPSLETFDMPVLTELEERAEILKHVKQVYSRSKVPSILRLAGEAFPLVNMGKGKFVAAGSSYGEGRVVVFGHEEFVSRLDSVGDFPIMVCNAIRWIAQKEEINVGFLVEKGYKDLSVNLITNGFKVSVITTDELEGVDVLFTDCYKRFTKSQLLSLHEFIDKGAGMVLAGQNWEYKTSYANDLLQGCGIYITDYYSGTGPLYMSNNLSSVGDQFKQFSEISSLPLDEVSARKVLFRDVRNLVVGSIEPSVLEVSGHACALAETVDGNIIIAASTLGQGKILCISHEALLKETSTGDDFPLFVLNTFKWLTNEKPAPNVGFLVAKDYKGLEKTLSENKFNVNFMTTDQIHTADVIIAECYTEYDESSINNIQRFVRGGGSLIVVGQNCQFKTVFANEILLGCGIQITTKSAGSNQVLLGTNEPEVSIDKSDEIIDKSMMKRKILKFVWKLDATGVEPSELKLSGEAFPLVTSRQNLVVAAAAPLGKGKIVVLGHEEFVKKVGEGSDDFPLMVQNIFDELIKDGVKKVGMLVSFGYEALKSNLIEADFEVAEINTAELNLVHAVFADCYTRFDEQQLLDIYSFVTNGGGLLVAGENWFFKKEHANDVLLGCGIKITPSFGGGDQVYEPENDDISDIHSCMMIDAMTSKDAILRNVTLLDGRGCEPSGLKLSNYAFPLVKSKQGNVVVAGAPLERGQVVVFGHESFVKKTGEADDFPLLLQNIFHWMVRGKYGAAVGLLSSEGYSSLEDNLREAGFTVMPVTTDNLGDVDAIFADSYTKFDEKQLGAIHSYLRKGRGLVVAGHNWFFKHDWVNDVLLGSGIEITSEYGGGNQIYELESNFEKEYPIVLENEYISEVSTKTELFKGVRRLEAFDIEPSEIKTIGKAFPLIISREGKTIAAAASCGRGKVVALGHEQFLELKQSTWNDFPKFVTNTCKWLSSTSGQTFGFLVPIEKYKRFKNNLRSAKFTVPVITTDQLSSVNVVYSDIYTKFDAKELRKIRSFVTNGGGLLVAGQNWHLQRNFANDILFDSGIVFTKSKGGGQQVYVPTMPYSKPREVHFFDMLFCCMFNKV